VRIDINTEADLSEDATTAILGATMAKGLAAAVVGLELLAERYGKELIVGPI
jgi:hypothetical protein